MRNSCRFLPGTVEGWRTTLRAALAIPNSELLSPPHFQAYCVTEDTNRVRTELSYASMLGSSAKAIKRRSAVLVLLEPVTLSSCDLLDKHNNDSLVPSSSPKQDEELHKHIQSELRTYVTLRQGHMRTHKGEIAFPGGKVDEGETLEQAAAREGLEEVGVDPDRYEILGAMSRVYSFPSRSFVTPVIAISKSLAHSPCVRHSGGRYSDYGWTDNGMDNSTYSKPRNGAEKPIEFDKSMPNTATVTDKPVDGKLWTPESVGDKNDLSVPFRCDESSLNLHVNSACEVQGIESVDLCRLLFSTSGHKFIERSWKAPDLGADKMHWMLPAFDTAENRQMLWGLSGFVFCELLCRIAMTLQREHRELPVGATPLEMEAHKQLSSFFTRSSHHYRVKYRGTEGHKRVLDLPPPDVAVPFVNPYDTIEDLGAKI